MEERNILSAERDSRLISAAGVGDAPRPSNPSTDDRPHTTYHRTRACSGIRGCKPYTELKMSHIKYITNIKKTDKLFNFEINFSAKYKHCKIPHNFAAGSLVHRQQDTSSSTFHLIFARRRNINKHIHSLSESNNDN